jgi:hypothetical protein
MIITIDNNRRVGGNVAKATVDCGGCRNVAKGQSTLEQSLHPLQPRTHSPLLSASDLQQ